jgi:hypothetical protein
MVLWNKALDGEVIRREFSHQVGEGTNYHVEVLVPSKNEEGIVVDIKYFILVTIL